MSERFNQEVKQFVKKVIYSKNVYNALSRLRLLEYLQKNPKFSGTAEEFASRVNQEFFRTLSDIRHLEIAGIFVRTNSQGEPLYALTQDENILGLIRETVILYNNSETRPQLLESLLPY